MKIKQFTDFYEAFMFLKTHNMNIGFIKETKYTYNKFFDSLSVEVVKVNPENETIEDNEELNTATRVWLEFGPYDFEENCRVHDTNLDCGGKTFEEAIIKLANLVNAYYDERGKERTLPELRTEMKCYSLVRSGIICDVILIETFIYDEYDRMVHHTYSLINRYNNANKPTLTLDEVFTEYTLKELRGLKEYGDDINA